MLRARGTTAYSSSTGCTALCGHPMCSKHSEGTALRGHPMCSKHSEGDAVCSSLLIDAVLEDKETPNNVLETCEALCSRRSPKRPQALIQKHDGSDGNAYTCNAGDVGSVPRLERPPGGRSGHPPQCSCLENPMYKGVWQALVHGVTKSRMRLNAPAQSRIRSVSNYFLDLKED